LVLVLVLVLVLEVRLPWELRQWLAKKRDLEGKYLRGKNKNRDKGR